jgi:phosphoadenosine phosphosulfate reductase
MKELADISTLADAKNPVQTLKNLAKEFAGKIAFSTSFSLEDQVITDMIFSYQIPIRVFTLDTGRLFKETHQVLEDTNKAYKQNIEVFFPESKDLQKLVSTKGNYSFYDSVENRKECCFIRKVVPLNLALEGVDCWITGIRGGQSDNRQSNMDVVEWDEGRGIVKAHPLFAWSLDETEKYILDNNVPYNKLYDQGYPSIGCEPCTRAVKVGEALRAGRWWWENPTKKECGLHK